MGSVLEEHVKLFAAVLEDVWIQSKKMDQVEVLHAIRRTPEPTLPTEKFTTPTKSYIPEKITSTPTEQPSVAPEPEVTIQPKPVIRTEPPKEIPEYREEASMSTAAIGSTDASLSAQIDKLLNNLETMTGYDIAASLQTLQDDILEIKGYSAVLRQIRMGITPLKSNPNLLNASERQDLISKINFWRNKLKI
ncbi:unnamed protein product [marine sediment metagenome]|uniref:Uncharacterized protein n=1 Tax=marine sediment metagenome TaxID=412755 RepID=X1BV63_9ZZZZ